MRLEIGKLYRSPAGKVERIMGPTREHPEWVWTLAGNWYEQATGRAIWYSPYHGSFVLESDWRTLNEEVAP